MYGIGWELKFSDRHMTGWIAFVAYLVVAGLTIYCAIQSRNRDNHRMVMWGGLGVILLGLGLNKQFDIHNLIRDIGRNIIVQLGMYEGRRIMQAIFVFLLANLFIICFVGVIYLLQDVVFEHQVMLGGVLILVGYVFFQASALHHWNPIGFLIDTLFIDLVEILGIVLIGIDAGEYIYRTFQIPRQHAQIQRQTY